VKKHTVIVILEIALAAAFVAAVAVFIALSSGCSERRTNNYITNPADADPTIDPAAPETVYIDTSAHKKPHHHRK